MFNWWKTLLSMCVFCVLEVIGSPAQTFNTLCEFSGADGAGPNGGLVQATNGNFYGATYSGGTSANCGVGLGCGTVFEITPAGKLTTLHSFDLTDGAIPSGGLVQATNGNFYGTTSFGGTSLNCADGCGTVFEITPAGKFTALFSFNFTDGAGPNGGLVQATNGNLYGTTSGGGTSLSCIGGCGTVFEITPAGKLTTLHSFDLTDGFGPTGLVQATNGNFYGETQLGGTSSSCSEGCGTVFEITPAGKLTTLHNFDNSDGSYSAGGLTQATNGNFYGTTDNGGTSGYGTVFEITPAGKLTTLHNFDNTDGSYANGVMQATNGNFYGTTEYGGTSGNCNGRCGTVFEITPAGKLTTLRSFNKTDGSSPTGGLVQATNGSFYGTTQLGGTSGNCSGGCGTVFSLSVGLGPFVETRPTSGKVGAKVIILGYNLTDATSVTFNGEAATFRVVSSTEITTSVPSDATTGKVRVKTPGRTLISNVNFRVSPTISSFSPTSGPVGTNVVITGKSFIGASTVTFGGVKATSFTVDSYAQITATVPTGAKTGKIGVSTQGGTATSAETFTVTM